MESKTLMDYEEQINMWHVLRLDIPVHSFLGLTWEQYRDLVSDDLRVGLSNKPLEVTHPD